MSVRCYTTKCYCQARSQTIKVLKGGEVAARGGRFFTGGKMCKNVLANGNLKFSRGGKLL